ncbi:MAG TPA: hypothetical protein HA276_00710 [Candidatus Poseidoniaceae archaeon]|nr:MAG TPA: hypothetical protein D7I01_00705 [Candidatus Poseidoniales archaeon]HII96186.1 hypothetical protein [Candidatus Poseidoniaceae archaeon]
MDGFMDEETRQKKADFDVETTDFGFEADLAGTSVRVDLLDFHRANKGALTALQAAQRARAAAPHLFWNSLLERPKVVKSASSNASPEEATITSGRSMGQGDFSPW